MSNIRLNVDQTSRLMGSLPLIMKTLVLHSPKPYLQLQELPTCSTDAQTNTCKPTRNSCYGNMLLAHCMFNQLAITD